MIRCVVCYQSFVEHITISTLLKPKIYCNNCLDNLQTIDEGCKYCSHPIGYNCCDKSIINISVFIENQFLKDTLYQIKYYNLYKKLFLFEDAIYNIASNYINHSVIPVPLSSIMKNKRGFNQSFILASFTKLPIIDCLERVDNITQSQKSYYERVNNPPKFRLKYLPKNKNILLIDDIYTTGSTLKSIIHLFPEDFNITCLTLQRTILK